MLVAIPKRSEQENIVSHFEEVQEKVLREEFYLKKLALLKSGLMSDLLSGRVCVPENLELPE
jgi:hypothetical protein